MCRSARNRLQYAAILSLATDNNEDKDNDDGGTVDMTKIPRRVVLSHKEFACKCRMAYARCYYTVQGKTCRDKHVLLLDTSHWRFDMRKLIVGLSRATHGQYVHVATPADEQQLMAACAVPEGIDDDVAPSAYAADEDLWDLYC